MSVTRRLEPWMIVSAAWIVPAVLGGLNVFAQVWLRTGRSPSWPDVAFSSLDWLIYGGLTPGVFLASRRWPLTRPNLVAHSGLHLLLALLFCAAWAGAGTLLKGWLSPGQLERGAGFFFTSWVFITLPFGVTVYLSMVGVEHAVRLYVDARDRDLQMARLSQQLARAQLDALHSKLNPHFLFNTLNTIAVLARDGRSAEAARVVEHLSEILRRTLRDHRDSEVSLEDEMELVRQYLAIERVRFSDRLRIVIDADPRTLGLAVPGFALQHLVDNAVRHGIAQSPEAGRIEVRARLSGDDLELTVTDDGAGLDLSQPPRHGRGIANTRDRLSALYGGRASLTLVRGAGRGTIATLRLPARERPREAQGAES